MKVFKICVVILEKIWTISGGKDIMNDCKDPAVNILILM